MIPKVFVSHASEDKERFVIPFATALRARGVDAWVDKWEMLPGDSLVDKIFEEGLDQALAVIIVLSKVSVTKPWVREELNAAVVKRIETGSKLIPIVLDRCDVPGALKSTVWEGVSDTGDFAECLDRVTDSIFNRIRKPPIGESVPYLAPSVPAIRGLTAADATLLTILYDSFVERGTIRADAEAVCAAMESRGVGIALALESMEMLEHKGYAESIKTFGPGFKPACITARGVSFLLGDKEAQLVREVGLAVVNGGHRLSDAVAAAVGQPQPLVEHAFGLLAAEGHLTLSAELGPVKRIGLIKPSLRRFLNEEG